MAVVLAVLAAFCYGISDFLGGLASRRAAALTILIYSYPAGGVLMSALLVFFPGHLGLSSLTFGIAGGLAGLTGVVLMYTAMTTAPMNVVSPITALLAAAVPVLFAVVKGERPAVTTWAGIALGLLAVVLVSRTSDEHPHGRVPPRIVVLALFSGVGFGTYFVCLAQPPPSSGIWPLVVSRLTAAVVIFPLAARGRALARLSRPLLGLALLTGTLDAVTNLLFLQATRHGYLSVAGVITSLYPVATVALAAVVLRERTVAVQRVGLVLAAGAIVLITV